MTSKHFLYFSFIIILLAGCKATSPLRSTVQPQEIKEVGLLPSISLVKEVVNDNESGNIDELKSQIEVNSEVNFDEIATICGIKSTKIELPKNEGNIVYKEIFKHLDTLLAFRQEKRKKMYPASGRFGFDENRVLFSNLSLSDSTVNILKATNQRFVVFILTAGRTRSISNSKALRRANAGTNAVGIGLGLLTGYGFYSIQNLYFLENHVLILDIEKKNLAYYTIMQSENGNPADAAELRKNIQFAFEGYLLTKNAETGRFEKK
jgi:hypothetical protein